MFEAVGKKFWPTYFGKLAQSPEAGRHCRITARLSQLSITPGKLRKKQTPDFIQRYIFPGGVLPAFEALEAPLMGANLTLSGK